MLKALKNLFVRTHATPSRLAQIYFEPRDGTEPRMILRPRPVEDAINIAHNLSHGNVSVTDAMAAYRVTGRVPAFNCPGGILRITII